MCSLISQPQLVQGVHNFQFYLILKKKLIWKSSALGVLWQLSVISPQPGSLSPLLFRSPFLWPSSPEPAPIPLDSPSATQVPILFSSMESELDALGCFLRCCHTCAGGM